ncbi:MAG: hypothetical protein JEY71_16640 [Sphaerochaeta sp.]|nr:hypothetical protein [Sphaerochaeta sp.]
MLLSKEEARAEQASRTVARTDIISLFIQERLHCHVQVKRFFSNFCLVLLASEKKYRKGFGLLDALDEHADTSGYL